MKVAFRAVDDGSGFQKAAQAKMQAASVSAITQTMDDAKGRGRASITGGGFGTRWSNALRTKVYENADKPLSPAGIMWHKIRYSHIFEVGGPVQGKPMLWLPLPGVPLGGRGSHQLTATQYAQRIGELRSVNRAGKPPMLVGRGTRAGILRASATQVRVRKRAVKKGSILGTQWVPLFIGVPKVIEPKRFSLVNAVKQAADKLPGYYNAAMGS
jgi:hypothetical protein